MENAPIFVKIEEYKEILKLVDVINEKLDEIKISLDDLRKIKEQEDQHLQDWGNQVELVMQKMAYINETLKEM